MYFNPSFPAGKLKCLYEINFDIIETLSFPIMCSFLDAVLMISNIVNNFGLFVIGSLNATILIKKNHLPFHISMTVVYYQCRSTHPINANCQSYFLIPYSYHLKGVIETRYGSLFLSKCIHRTIPFISFSRKARCFPQLGRDKLHDNFLILWKFFRNVFLSG